jgi:GxxExxY protein
MGPGLLESSYEDCLDLEFQDRGIMFSRQIVVPLNYQGRPLASVYRLDLIVEKCVIIEIKAVDKLTRLHLAQMLSYLKHTGLHVGLIINFNCEKLPDGIIRVSL